MSLEIVSAGDLPRIDLDKSTGNVGALHTAQSKGILSHGEHVEDLVLIQGAYPGSQFVDGFLDICQDLGSSSGRIELNEKFDGKPSIVAGFDVSGEPFVAYKGGLTRVKGGQLIFRDERDVLAAFKEGDGRIPLYLDIVRSLIPAMRAAQDQAGGGLTEFIFQGDLLFHQSGDTRVLNGDRAIIRANTVEYRIDASHPNFSAITESDIGVVFHTIARREISGVRIEQSAHHDPELIKGFVSLINRGRVFALDPFNSSQVTPTPDELVSGAALKIEGAFRDISDEFRERWSRGLLARFRVFLNSGLQPGADGGIYALAAKERPLSATTLSREFKRWLRSRVHDAGEDKDRVSDLKRDLKQFNSLLRLYRSDFESLMTAYYEAIKLHYLIDKTTLRSVRSKLGGGDLEGLMFRSGELIVKWVDRLHFTRKNNDNWRGDGSRWSDLDQLPAPFEVWKPGMVVIPMKLQPPHIGHILMLRDAIKKFGAQNVVILASDKAPNLDAQSWKDLKLADRRASLADGRFTHPFSVDLRRELLRLGLGSDVQIAVTSPSILRDYLRRAKEAGASGKIFIALGEKERSVDRYSADLKSYKGLLGAKYLPLQSGGISGTAVRESYIAAARGDLSASMPVLEQAFSYISDDTVRRNLIERSIGEYRRDLEVVEMILAKQERPKKLPAPRKRVVRKKS